MTSPAPAAEPLLSEAWSPAGPGRAPLPRRLVAALPSWPLIATRHLELRKRRGLMVVVGVMTIGPTTLILGFRLAFHLFDPAHYGPAGTPASSPPRPACRRDWGSSPRSWWARQPGPRTLTTACSVTW